MQAFILIIFVYLRNIYPLQSLRIFSTKTFSEYTAKQKIAILIINPQERIIKIQPLEFHQSSPYK